jgi:hypothetical protein
MRDRKRIGFFSSCDNQGVKEKYPPKTSSTHSQSIV